MWELICCMRIESSHYCHSKFTETSRSDAIRLGETLQGRGQKHLGCTDISLSYWDLSSNMLSLSENA